MNATGMCRVWKARSGLIARVTLAMSAVVLPLGATAWAQEASHPVKIGVLAKRGPERCTEKWEPTADYLTNQIPGYTFTIVPLGYDEVHPATERGEVDFVLTNPSFYVEAEKLYGSNRIATLKSRHLDGTVHTVYGGVILCRADRNDIHDLRDIKGKTFMAVAERSFGGWRTVWREFKHQGIEPHRDFADLRFSGTQDAVICAVRDGKVDAGSVQSHTLERMALEGKIRLEDFHVLHNHMFEYDGLAYDEEYLPFLHSTRPYPEWPMAKLAHTSDELAEKVAIALIGMPADCPAAQAARCAGWTVPFNYQPIHACLKELRVGPYADYGKITFGDVLKRYWPWIVAAGAFLAMGVITTLYVLRLNRKLSRSRGDLFQELGERRRVEEALQQTMARLRESVARLEQFNRLAVDREHQMIELKRQINELAAELGRSPLHDLSFLQTAEGPGGQDGA